MRFFRDRAVSADFRTANTWPGASHRQEEKPSNSGTARQRRLFQLFMKFVQTQPLSCFSIVLDCPWAVISRSRRADQVVVSTVFPNL